MVWLHLGEEPRPPPKKSTGTQGTRIKLKSNYFAVEIKNPNIELIHYDVAITEPGKREVSLPKAKRMLIFESLKKQYPKVFRQYALAFDSEKNAYCICSIPQIKKGFQYEVMVINPENRRTSKYIVTLTVVNHAYLRDLMNSIRNVPGKSAIFPQTIFQMLEVMFQHTPSIKYDRVGKNTFYSSEGEFGPPIPLEGGKEGVVGFFSSLKPCAWKDGSLLLNIDICHTAYYKEQPVLNHLGEVLGFSPRDYQQTLDPGRRRRLIRELKGLKIQVTHAAVSRTYKVTDVTSQGADRQTFPLTDAQTKRTTNCTVERYFQMQYNKRLQYPALNCLKVGPQNRTIYIPIEFCKICKGQKVNKKLSDQETSKLIRKTAKPPSERLRNICNIARAKDFSNDPMIKSLQFTIADQPVILDGRVLPPPSLRMNEELVPRQGVWDARDRSFFNGAQLKTWVVMNYEPKFISKETLAKFLLLLKKMGEERGMSFQPPQLRQCSMPNPEREFVEIKSRYPDVQMILVVLPKFGDIYARVKKTGDREVMVVTQCVKSINVNAAEVPTVGNLLLKINAKMGGTNNILSTVSQPVVFTSPVMIMGADVNHPQAGDKLTPSLAAVVASMDRYASKYAVEVRHQKHRTEMIQEMREMTKNLLKGFYAATQRKPDRIIMYRDGVSESQFLEVLSFELKAMRSACTELQADYQPAITFLVVQKRHHTRLFCQEKDGVGKAKNIPPGTTVDTYITHPSENDFFLCSHQGIQGTSRPTHYHVLWDDSDMSMDQLQKLTYAMCHLYSRCTRSVSIPAPAYYAHLAAFRAKVHIQDLCLSETSSMISGEEPVGPSDAIMSRACKIERGNEIFSKLYYV